ncbi:DUF4834 family protein [Coprobacter fastidiosus]|uniref:DUF4834 family protein n=1 Tax=Coprobacter fastidiosus TaxID=1099853 RepID=UPI001DF73728|nr:DUF4834 family protein [Coprobacter fastidiosus]HJF43807.1 DUF4834 family protein [Coprobacter fastidiosus]
MVIILYSLLFIFIFILLLGLGFIGTIIRVFFGNTRRNPADTTKNSGNRQDGRSSTKWYTYPKRREKIFDKTDGEYVEFEEIKEEK